MVRGQWFMRSASFRNAYCGNISKKEKKRYLQQPFCCCLCMEVDVPELFGRVKPGAGAAGRREENSVLCYDGFTPCNSLKHVTLCYLIIELGRFRLTYAPSKPRGLGALAPFRRAGAARGAVSASQQPGNPSALEGDEALALVSMERKGKRGGQKKRVL